MPTTYKGLLKLFLTLFLFTFLLYKFPLQARSAVASHLVISEVQISGDGGVPASDEFVELYNPTDTAIVMESWLLTRKNGAGTEANLVSELNGTVPAHGYFLIGHETGYNGATSLDVPYSAPSNALTSNYAVLLYDNTNAPVDKVGFGNNPDGFETAVFDQNPEANSSVERKACPLSTDESMLTVDLLNGNAEDTDDNSGDFVLREVSDPQNSSSATETPNCATPSGTPAASPTESPEESPTPIATPTPTIEPSPSPTATPEPTPEGFVIARFAFPGRTTLCTVTHEAKTVWFLKFRIPRISCN
ncbi:hypothetical protein A3H21_03125 [Candidatus Woesebacteria bacterium RIFCSPLOWO2_12_FULL_42_8]|nr:MAG: hypothetical protein A3H21_03125 [Candidatus Woesebacteria bacterium RIFCSPLOWO2_12_FULL_42_8]